MENDEHPKAAEDTPLELNFVPQWARKPSADNPYTDFRGGGRDEREERGGRRGYPGREREERGFGAERRRTPFAREERRVRPERGPRRDAEPRAPEAPAARPAGRPERRGPRTDFAPRLPVDIHFLPDREPLGGLVRKMHAAHRAYPLAQLAHLFLDKPEACSVKIETLRGGGGEPLKLFQCKTCRQVFLNRPTALDHVADAHLEDVFTIEETISEPPTGQFVCIARCRRSGKLLGPPNHHSFNEALLEWHREHFAHESLDDYRHSLEMIHDPALIEQWKTESVTRKVYRRKDTADAPALRLSEARAAMEKEIAPARVAEATRAILPATAARQTSDGRLQRALRDAWTREDRFPVTLMLALRPALKHMGLHLFKAGENHTFIAAVAPTALNPAHAIPPIRDALTYLAAHPGITNAQMLDDLFPGTPADHPPRQDVLRHLRWLIDKGHVIEFFDGTLAVPRPSSPAQGHAGNTVESGNSKALTPDAPAADTSSVQG